jgi:hypothetical protein
MKRRTRTPAFVDQLVRALEQELARAGVKADVSSEPVPGTKFYRFYVQTPKFRTLDHSERQGVVWSIVERTLRPQDRLFVSMILTLTPAELKGAA